MHYRAPLAEIQFCLEHMLDREHLLACDAYPELESATTEAILREAARTFEDRVAPAHRVADTEGARFENGVVRTPDAFHDAYASLREGGWIGVRASAESGGLGMAQSIATPVNEMLASACPALALCPVLTQGAILALERHAAPEIAVKYLPRLASGEWAGTMNLTEAEAGSDVGALRTRAEPRTDGSWSITGEKIFISWGDSDLTRNVVHLVLARTPGAPSGTAGISMFLVPKFLPDDEGEPGEHNRVRAISMEEKMGLHGSPTLAMSYEGAQGWLVGEEKQGMHCMFTMMNAARLGVGLQGVAIAEVACQAATAHALNRRQGRTATGEETIIGHPDVRRMLLRARVLTTIARALCYDLATTIDLETVARDDDERNRAANRKSLLTPIAKAFGSDVGCEVADLNIQIHGGAGYIAGTGAEQLYRDARIARIYEGTNGIQALDLVGRRLLPDQGHAVQSLLTEIESTMAQLESAGGTLFEVGLRGRRAIRNAQTVTAWLLNASCPKEWMAGADSYLRLLALTRGTHYLGRGALADRTDPKRLALLLYHAGYLLPETAALVESACAGPTFLYPHEATGFEFS